MFVLILTIGSGLLGLGYEFVFGQHRQIFSIIMLVWLTPAVVLLGGMAIFYAIKVPAEVENLFLTWFYGSIAFALFVVIVADLLGSRAIIDPGELWNAFANRPGFLAIFPVTAAVVLGLRVAIDHASKSH